MNVGQVSFILFALSSALLGCSTATKEEKAAATYSQLSTGREEWMAGYEVELLETHYREHGVPDIPEKPIFVGRTLSKKRDSKGVWEEVWLVKRGLFTAAYTLRFVPLKDGTIDVQPDAIPKMYLVVPAQFELSPAITRGGS